jgi:hypothetical protein
MLCVREAGTGRPLLLDPATVLLARPFEAMRHTVLTLDGGVQITVAATLPEVEEALTDPRATWIGTADDAFSMVWSMAQTEMAAPSGAEVES